MGKHIVDLALKKIKKNYEVNGIRVDITEDDIKIARLASLLHDVGHQPFSHALDKLIPDPHEKYSSAIVKSEFSKIIDKSGITAKDVTKLIEGKPPLKKPFLSSLINSQLDVDKFDFFGSIKH